ncbi:MAG: DUF554 domain-containing protein [Paludibacteraceae bacterium]|nr:DUF554 domain-containing protein [Paludibacteraceae bacterium]MEE3482797.1 DUF554 domain-containing protein [Bacteroidales bacterium]
MLGTIVNTCTILIGSTLGCLLRKGIGDKYKKTLFDGLGLCCLVLGMNAALPNMSKSEYPVLFILSIAIGGLIGTKLNIENRINQISQNNKGAVQGLTTGVLLYCIGTFSIVGPVLSALSPSHGWAFDEPDNTFLYTNATLDLVTSAVLAASYGRIMLLAAPILFCWQSLFYMIAYYFSAAMPEPMRIELSIVGGVLIISSGLSILNIKNCKTVNLLPSLLIPILFYTIKELI